MYLHQNCNAANFETLKLFFNLLRETERNVNFLNGLTIDDKKLYSICQHLLNLETYNIMNGLDVP